MINGTYLSRKNRLNSKENHRVGISMKKYRIMSFDDGGIRGILTAILLKRLLSYFPALFKNVDLFVGTSTGSYIALALAAGKTADDLVKLYSEQYASFIFTPKHRHLLRPRYSNKHLKYVLQSIFPKLLRLSDLKHHVLITSFYLGNSSKNWQPVFFHNYPSSTAKDKTVIDAALASSAAPTYFPSYHRYIDGGVIANNPSTAAIAIAIDQKAGNQQLNNIHLLSIGTGFFPNKITENTKKWGVIQWGRNPSPPPEFPLLSILQDGVVEADTYYSSQLLNNRYYRLNPALPETIALDDYKQIPKLIAIAENIDLKPTIRWLQEYWLYN